MERRNDLLDADLLGNDGLTASRRSSVADLRSSTSYELHGCVSLLDECRPAGKRWKSNYRIVPRVGKEKRHLREACRLVESMFSSSMELAELMVPGVPPVSLIK